MRRPVIVRLVPLTVAALVPWASPSHAQQRTSPPQPTQRVFREVQFPPHNPIRLGEALGPSAPAGVLRAADRYVVRGAGGTDSITIRLDGAGRVRALQFAYPASASFAAQLDAYAPLLGTPHSRQVTDSAGGRVEHAVWEDADTRFELLRFSRGDTTIRLTSRLADKRSLPDRN